MMPFYEAFKLMSERGWFCRRKIIDDAMSVDGETLHIGVLRNKQTFIFVQTDKNMIVKDIQVINNYWNADDFFASDWEQTCRNDWVDFDFQGDESTQMRESDYLELEIWPEHFETNNEVIHHGVFNKTVRYCLKHRLYRLDVIGVEDTEPMFNVDYLCSDVSQKCNRLIHHLNKISPKRGVKSVNRVEFKLTPRGLQVEVQCFTDKPNHRRVTKHVYLKAG